MLPTKIIPHSQTVLGSPKKVNGGRYSASSHDRNSMPSSGDNWGFTGGDYPYWAGGYYQIGSWAIAPRLSRKVLMTTEVIDI